ncbi:hypothetical protein MLD38_008421 [Melastoma candidum]|uniref:Uncharacterized protein n=1 Tax=Melastoma candidum TaxID=119954 RepID=A0ACB9RYK0_9MYRT|nr:hypothetical protein MLD38_008421 [Melastoma candidum]
MHEEEKRRKTRKAARRMRSQRAVMVADKGIQTEEEMNLEEKLGGVDVGVQTKSEEVVEEVQALQLAMERSCEIRSEDKAVEEAGIDEGTHITHGDGINLGRVDNGHEQAKSDEFCAEVTEGRVEEENTTRQDFVKGNEDQGKEIEESVNLQEELSIAEGIIILGWKETAGTDGINPHFVAQANSGMVEGSQTGDHPAQDAAESDPLRILLNRVMEGFVDLDADEKLIQCQAMKFIIENIGSPSEETTRLLDFMTDLVRKGVHQKLASLYGVSSVESQEEQDRIELQAKESIRLQVEQDATQQRMEEELLGMLWRLEIAGPSVSAMTCRVVSWDVLKKCFESWKSATNLKRELLIRQLRNVEKEMELMSVKALDPTPPAVIPQSLRGDTSIPHIPVDEQPGDPVGPQFVRELQPPDASDKELEGIPAVNEEVIVRRVPSGPDGQPLGAPRSPGPDSRLNNIITLIYDKVEDPVGHPRALDQHEIRSIMRDLWHIRNESNRAARRNKCRALRDHIVQFDGVADFLAGLHEAMLCRAEEEARAAQEANEDPLPFFSFGPTHDSQDTSFDDTSPEEDGGEELWSDDGHICAWPLFYLSLLSVSARLSLMSK